MCKKTKIKKIIGILFFLGCVNIVVFGTNLNLKFNSINIGFTGTPKIHFSASGNDFLGTLLIDNIELLSPPQTITMSGSGSKTCNKQLHGLYYNSSRGNRVRPLDQSGLDQLKEINSNYSENLTVKGGLFTECTNSDTGSIFGYVEHKRTIGGHTMDYYLVAGVGLDYTKNKYVQVFTNNFQIFDVTQGVNFLGFIRDNYGGIGLVGGPSKLEYGTDNLINFLNESTGTIKTAFIYSGNKILSTKPNPLDGWEFKDNYLELGGTNLFWNLFVRGNVGLSNSYKDTNNLSTNTQSEALLFNLSDTNVSTLVNTARKNVGILCRDRWTGGSALPDNTSASVLCYKNTNLIIDLDAKNKYGNKTIVLNSGNVYLKNSMKGNYNPLELFIDKGILYLEKGGDLENFNQNGYIDGSTNFKADFLKGVFIVNGLIMGTGNWNNIFPHKLVIHGKLTSLNSPEPTSKRKEQVSNLLGAGYEDFVDLDNIFTWTCSYGGTGSDVTRCIGTGDIVVKPFVIIDKLDSSMKYKLLSY